NVVESTNDNGCIALPQDTDYHLADRALPPHVKPPTSILRRNIQSRGNAIRHSFHSALDGRLHVPPITSESRIRRQISSHGNNTAMGRRGRSNVHRRSKVGDRQSRCTGSFRGSGGMACDERPRRICVGNADGTGDSSFPWVPCGGSTCSPRPDDDGQPPSPDPPPRTTSRPPPQANRSRQSRA